MMYVWLRNKRSGKVHQLDENGTTFCKVENNGLKTIMRLTSASSDYPKDRKLCWCCKEERADRLHEATNGRLDREFAAILQQ